MYSESVDIYDKIYSFKDYHKEAAFLTDLIKTKATSAYTLLDVACGTGKHLQYLKEQFEAEGIDISARFVAAAKRNNPKLEFHVGDMVKFRLPKRYDVITCLFSSIGYVKTTTNLAKAITNMANHLATNGLLLIEPWFTPEAWHPNTAHATFVDEPELKIARMSTSKSKVSLSIMEMHYLVCTPQTTRHFTELHQLGLFSQEQMLDALRKANLVSEYQSEGLTGRGLYLGLKKGENKPEHNVPLDQTARMFRNG